MYERVELAVPKPNVLPRLYQQDQQLRCQSLDHRQVSTEVQALEWWLLATPSLHP